MLSFFAAYRPATARLVAHWSSNDMYSYWFIVPAISGFLVWSRRHALSALPLCPSLGLGGMLTLAGLTLLVVGRASSTSALEALSLVVTLGGLTLLLFGTTIFVALMFPLVYLFTMVPIWDRLTVAIQPYFQLYSADIGVRALRLAGIPVLREGIFIELPNIRLEVAEACSGVNYLISVLCIGVPITVVFVRAWPKRVVILAAAVAIALLSNGLRVAVVSLYAHYDPAGDLHGPYAVFRSLLISGVGFAALFGLVLKFGDRQALSETTSRQAAPVSDSGLRRVDARAGVLALVLLVAPLAVEHLHVVSAMPLRSSLDVFPTTFAGWHAADHDGPQHALGALPFDHVLTRSYAGPDGRLLNVFIGYFEKQEHGRELAGHDVRTAIGNPDESSYELGRGGGAGRVNDFLVKTNGRAAYIAYWYVLRGETLSQNGRTRWRMAWNSLVHGDASGAIVAVTISMPDTHTLDEARVMSREILISIFETSREMFSPSDE